MIVASSYYEPPWIGSQHASTSIAFREPHHNYTSYSATPEVCLSKLNLTITTCRWATSFNKFWEGWWEYLKASLSWRVVQVFQLTLVIVVTAPTLPPRKSDLHLISSIHSLDFSDRQLSQPFELWALSQPFEGSGLFRNGVPASTVSDILDRLKKSNMVTVPKRLLLCKLI